MNADEFRKELTDLIAQERIEREKAVLRYESARSELAGLDARIAALQTALEVYSQRHGLVKERSKVDESLRARFANMKTKDALVDIARENGGILLAAEAGHILVAAGFFKDRASAAGTIYPTLRRYVEVFEKTGKGKYRLRVPTPENGHVHGMQLSTPAVLELH